MKTSRTGSEFRTQREARRLTEAKAMAKADKANPLRHVASLPGNERMLTPYNSPAFEEIVEYAKHYALNNKGS